tara:strand:+ start:223 stop:1155 length:933 start_codon:yes stop_codon:yes gene_type:complete
MKYSNPQIVAIQKARKDLVLTEVPSINEVIVSFLKANGVDISPEDVEQEKFEQAFSAFVFIGAILTNFFINQSDDSYDYSATVRPMENDVTLIQGNYNQQANLNLTPAAVLMASQQMKSSSVSNQWDYWKKWCLDNKEFKKYKFERIDKVKNHNRKIIQKYENPQTQRQINKILFPFDKSIINYKGSPSFQQLLKKYDYQLNKIPSDPKRDKNDRFDKIRPFKNCFKWFLRINNVFFGIIAFNQLTLFFSYPISVFFNLLLGGGVYYLYLSFIYPFLTTFIEGFFVLCLKEYRSAKRKEYNAPFEPSDYI